MFFVALLIAMQTTSNTNCIANGNVVNCTTTTSPNYMDQFQKGLENMDSQLQSMQEKRERQRLMMENARLQSELNKREELSRKVAARDMVMNLVRQGKCPEAKYQALYHGEQELFQRVDAYCRSIAVPTSSQSTTPSNPRRVVPEGIYLNMKTSQKGGGYKCSFTDGSVRYVSEYGDCFTE